MRPRILTSAAAGVSLAGCSDLRVVRNQNTSDLIISISGSAYLLDPRSAKLRLRYRSVQMAKPNHSPSNPHREGSPRGRVLMSKPTTPAAQLAAYTTR
jgi:hypothetical protein